MNIEREVEYEVDRLNERYDNLSIEIASIKRRCGRELSPQPDFKNRELSETAIHFRIVDENNKVTDWTVSSSGDYPHLYFYREASEALDKVHRSKSHG